MGGPPLPPSQMGTSLGPARTRSKIQVECFLDLICPFSCKMYNTLYEGVLPALQGNNDSNTHDDIDIIIHQVIQPWHPQGTAIHEAALACKQVAPEKYPDYVHKIYAAYSTGQFQDNQAWDKTRSQLYQELIALLPDGVDSSAIQPLLQCKESGATNEMTQAIKWACKVHRTRGVHVTPTIFVNGVEAGVVSSGWTKDQWLQFLEKSGEDNFQGV